MVDPSNEAAASEKKPLRRTMRDRRASIHPAERRTSGERMRELCLELPELDDARGVFIYVSQGPEMPTHALIETLLERHVEVAVPVIEDAGRMMPARLTDLGELSPGRFGIPAPRQPRMCESPIDVILAPCVAVTPEGQRLGMGGGYYDRFLADHRSAFVAALAFEAQVADWLPTEPHDRRVDAIVTERRVIRCG